MGKRKAAAKTVKVATETPEGVVVTEEVVTPEMEEQIEKAEDLGEIEMTEEFLEQNPAVAALVEEESEIPEEVEAEIQAPAPKRTRAKKVVEPEKEQKILYAVDSDKLDAKIFEDIQNPLKKVTVLIKEKYSNASVNKYLKKNEIRMLTTFSAQFGNEEFDKAFIEQEMIDKVPAKIIESLK